ncbi:MAG: hypothetical protein AB3N28_12070 [Kordiimonas sp.]
MKNDVIVKLNDISKQTNGINKVVGTIGLKSFCDLISAADLDANPREAKVNDVVRDIEDSLDQNADIFHYMSKGVLVAARNVDELERGRLRLTFEEPRLEGILDGGHNTLAIGRYIVRTTLSVNRGEVEVEEILKGTSSWKGFSDTWLAHAEEILAHKAALNGARVPIEVLYPTSDPEGEERFLDKIIIISAARNNNAELKLEAKANKKGYYDALREAMDPEIKDEVEWKTNDGGRIKVRDLVSLALIPISKFDFEAVKTLQTSPSILFSSKTKCVKIFDDLMDSNGVTRAIEGKGEVVELVNSEVTSALALMKDLPRLFDQIYEQMPKSYNKGARGRFARLDQRGVKGSSDGEKKYSTRFYKNKVSYSYGEGFMFPLVYGLSALMKVKDGEIVWVTDPFQFVTDHLDNIMKSYYSMMDGLGFDPAKVGKSGGTYNLAYDLFQAGYRNDILKEHGLD